MSLFIYGIKLPISCGVCYETGLYNALNNLVENMSCEGSPELYSTACAIGCPLEEVQIPHGRLIDGDERYSFLCTDENGEEIAYEESIINELGCLEMIKAEMG